MDAEEIVLALRIVEGRKYFGIAGVLLPELLDAPLARLVVVVPVVHRKNEAVHVDVARLGDDLAVALDRSHAGITARPIFGGLGWRIGHQPRQFGYRQPSAGLQEPLPPGKAGREPRDIDRALGP